MTLSLQDIQTDGRIVLTLDAGENSFRFAAIQDGRRITDVCVLPSHRTDLERCLLQLVTGFSVIRQQCSSDPAAISFGFPGPADYAVGVVGDVPNLPAFRGGVPLGPLLEEEFELPVFINNSDNLFALGEATNGLLPAVNGLLARGGARKRFQNLLGVTLGSDFGAGIVSHGRMLTGDNSLAGQAWLLRHRDALHVSVEHGASSRGVRCTYAEACALPLDEVPDVLEIADIARGSAAGNVAAAREAFRRMGAVAGDAIAQAETLLDALVVVGGEAVECADLFLPALVGAMNDGFATPSGRQRRLLPRAFNLADPTDCETFVRGDPVEFRMTLSGRTLVYDRMPRVGVGLSRLGTSNAIALGAWRFALEALTQPEWAGAIGNS